MSFSGQPGMNQQPWGPGQPMPQRQNGLAIASLVCGIIAIALALLIAIGGILLGVVAVVLGVVARREPAQRPLSLAGIITGSIATVVGIANAILGAMLMTGKLHF